MIYGSFNGFKLSEQIFYRVFFTNHYFHKKNIKIIKISISGNQSLKLLAQT
jgi:hypothetical protein